MTGRRDRRPVAPAGSAQRTATVAALLSVLAVVVAVATLAVMLLRPSPQPAASADPNDCRTVAWNAIPGAAALPANWGIASTRILVDNLTLTLVGPAASGSSQGPAAYVSVSCFGSDAELALARNHEVALGAGSTDAAFPKVGEQSIAVTNTRAGSIIVYIRRGALVADVTAATSLDAATLQAVATAIDGAMSRALAASAAPSGTAEVTSSSPSAAATGSPAASPSASVAAVSHVAPDLEALLPKSFSGATFSTQSVAGTTALQTDVTSKSLTASLARLGKTAADLQIAEAVDASGAVPLRILGFRVKGVKAADLSAAIVQSWLANTTSAPQRSDVTIAGRKIVKVAYSQGADYVYQGSDVVFDIETSDESLVAKVLPLLK